MRFYSPCMTQSPPVLEFAVPGIDECIARWSYSGDAAALIRDLKYRRSTSLISRLADQLCEVCPPSDVITWVPATPRRRRERGFDQSELLARAIARRVGCRAVKLLRRHDSAAQTSRDLAGRLAGPKLTYVARRRGSSRSVLVIDDVSTTGSTLAAAASCLRARGHSRVSALVVARVVPFGATQSAPCRSIV